MPIQFHILMNLAQIKWCWHGHPEGPGRLLPGPRGPPPSLPTAPESRCVAICTKPRDTQAQVNFLRKVSNLKVVVT